MLSAPRAIAATVLLGLFASLTHTARAQTDPKFTFAKPEEAKPAAPAVEWKAQAKGGLLMTTGNSQTTNGTVGLIASRKQDGNKLSLEGALAYGKSTIASPMFAPTSPTTITGLNEASVVTTNNWRALGRYDRFFTANNAAYASGQTAADKIAGKTLAAGGQIGYSRQLVNTAHHLLVIEGGYDFSYERYVQQPGKTLDPVAIHSARLYAGETLKITPESGATASVETFLNLNKEDKALNVNPPHGPGVDALHDTRVIGKLGFSTTLWKSLSAAVGFTLRYDQNPAPRPLPPGAPAMATYAPDFQPFAEKVDTTTEVTLIYTFL